MPCGFENLLDIFSLTVETLAITIVGGALAPSCLHQIKLGAKAPPTNIGASVTIVTLNTYASTGHSLPNHRKAHNTALSAYFQRIAPPLPVGDTRAA